MISVGSSNSEARSAAFALANGWHDYLKDGSDRMTDCLSEMRKTAIDVICHYGYADDSVYDSLEKSYINNFISPHPDYDEIKKTLDALAAIDTDKSVRLLLLFLQGLHQKRNSGLWSEKETQIFPWITHCISSTKIISRNVWNLLMIIYRTDKYTTQERLHARNALVKIKENAVLKPINKTSAKS
ncbi:MAG: hypothetical protein FWB73_01980 [Treponema sp.]|nr:hypothetical protein [Treponema sp.]